MRHAATGGSPEEPGWIEVELEEAAPSRRRSRGAPAAASGPGQPLDGPLDALVPVAAPPADDPLLADRRWLVAAVAGAMVVVAIAGFAVGRAGRDGTAAQSAASPATTATTEPPSTTAPERADVRPPRTTVERPTTTTQVPVAQILMGARVLGAPVGAKLVGLDTSGDLVTLDLDVGRLVVTDLRRRTSGPEADLAALRDATVVVPWNGGRAVLVVDGREPVDLPGPNSGGGPIYPGPWPRSIWRVEYRMVEPWGTSLQLTDLRGESLGVSVDLDTGYPVMPDARGGVIAEATGGAYAAGVDGIVRLTTGRVMAIGVNHVVTKECDERLSCRYDVLDRRTGERRPVPDAIAGDGSFVTPTESIAPDGSAIVVYGARGALFGLTVVDLATGEITELPSLGGGSPSVAWTPDSRFVLYGIGRGVSVLDRTDGSIRELPDVVPSLAQFRLRPNDP
jgi:hypothetical protein